MSRTIHGNLTGAAAAAQISDEMQAAYDDWVRQERQKLIDRENELYSSASDLPGFGEFWDAVPEFGKRRERITLLEDFIQSKCGEVVASHCQGAFQKIPP